MLRGWSVAALAVGGMLLAGCVTSGMQYSQEGRAMLAARKGTTVGIGALKPLPLAMNQPVDVEIGGEDPVVEVDGQDVFAKFYALPEWSGPYSVNIASFREGSPSDPAILYPVVIFYDAELREVHRSEPGLFQYRLAGISRTDGLHGTMFINEPQKNCRYVLIGSTQPADIALKSVNLHTVQQTYIATPVGAAWIVPTGGQDHRSQMVASPRGKLSLSLQAYQLKKMDGAKDQVTK